MALLEAHGLVKIYGKRKVVDGVSFEVNAGEVVGLLGPNGAGKTTSFRMTTGQIQPNDGRVVFNGEEVTTLPMFRRARLGMGYLTQEQSIFRRLSVEKNILAILEALPQSRSLGRKLTKDERWERTNAMLERFQLTHVRHNSSARCSGGEKRRLEIARCLVCEPLLILLDEPFAAVDPKTTEDIRRNIRDLAQHGIGILLTDHNVREVLKITDRSYLIKDGKVVTHGSPQQIINDPIAIAEYLGTTFTDNTFGPEPTRPAPASVPAPSPASGGPANGNGTTNGTLHAVAEQELLRRYVESLKGDPATATMAAQELMKRVPQSLGALSEGLESRDSTLRVRAFEVIRRIIPDRLDFDPNAGVDQRAKQLQTIRRQLGLTK
jgi:lipopolysaccharide export system ATP-binding protein